jgi:hypothetical protein
MMDDGLDVVRAMWMEAFYLQYLCLCCVFVKLTMIK